MTKMLWNAKTGEAQVFADNDTPPAGFIDHHPADVEKGGKPAKDPASPAEKPLTKAEIVAALEAGGVEFDKGAKADVLGKQLHDALVAALTASNTAMTGEESTRELLAMVEGAQG
jgi:hypothetical protein